ncbi:MAG: glycerophosphodiester phosphodiesterase [Planctomycetota bacterium]
MRPILIEAHRGDSSNAPENTLAAFERAVALGVPSIELDVHAARDGTLMVIHDDTVDRTTNGTGAVADLSCEELGRLDAGAWFSAAYAGQRPPTLLDVLRVVAPAATRLNVEVKASPRGDAVAASLVRLLRQVSKQHEYVVSSFDLACLLEVRRLDDGITLALLGTMPDILPLAEKHTLPWIHCHHKSVTAEGVRRAHDRGIAVNVWTVNDPATLGAWRRLGIDKLCTNRPAAMLAAARQA